MLLTFNKTFCFGICLLFFSIGAFGQKDAVITRAGHTDKINAVAFSSDGKLLASAGNDDVLIVWDTATGTEKWNLQADTENSEYFTSVAFSPDGKILAVGTSNLLRIHDARTGKQIKTLAEDYPGIESVAFSSDGRMLAAASGVDSSGLLALVGVPETQNKAGIWNVANFEEIRTFEDARSPVAFNRTGTQLATAAKDKTIKIWDTRNGRAIRTIKHDNKIKSLSFNPAGTILLGVLGNESGFDFGGMEIGLWKVLNGTRIKVPDETSSAGSALFTPDGKNIVIGDPFPIEDGLILLSPLSGKPTGSFGSSFRANDAAAFSGDGKYLAVVEKNGYDISIFDFQKKSRLRTLKGHTTNVVSLAFTDDGKNVLGGYDDGTLIWWDTATAKAGRIVSVPPKEDEIRSPFSDENEVFISPDGKYFAAADHGLSFFSTTDGRALTDTAVSDEFLFSPDGKVAVSISAETFTLREVPDGKILSRTAHQFQEIPYGTRISLSYDKKTLAVTIGSNIFLFNTADGKTLKILEGFSEDGSITGFSPDGRLLVVSNPYNDLIQVVDLTTGKIRFDLEQVGPYFAFNPEGTVLAAVSGYDYGIRLIKVQTGEVLATGERTYDGVSKPVTLTFSRDGSLLAVGGARGIKILETATGKEINSMK